MIFNSSSPRVVIPTTALVCVLLGLPGCKSSAQVSRDANTEIVPFEPTQVCNGTGILDRSGASQCPTGMVIPYDFLGVQGDTDRGLIACTSLNPSGAGFQVTATILDAPQIIVMPQGGLSTLFHARAATDGCGLLFDFRSPRSRARTCSG